MGHHPDSHYIVCLFCIVKGMCINVNHDLSKNMAVYTCLKYCVHMGALQVQDLHIWLFVLWRYEFRRILKWTWSKSRAETQQIYVCGVETSCIYYCDVNISIQILIYIYIYIYVYAYIYICIYTRMYMYSVSVCMYSVSVYMYMYLCMYKCICIVYLCICI